MKHLIAFAVIATFLAVAYVSPSDHGKALDIASPSGVSLQNRLIRGAERIIQTLQNTLDGTPAAQRNVRRCLSIDGESTAQMRTRCLAELSHISPQ